MKDRKKRNKVPLEQATKAQMRSRGYLYSFFNIGARRG
jgi:hypothetical protein